MNPYYRCLGVCVLALSGCKAGYFHSETTLLPDGSIERAILQPHSGTPEAAQEPEAWDQAGWTTQKSFSDLQGRIRDLELAQKGSDYFAAWTKVDAVDKLPDHYIKHAAHEDFTSYFERRFVRRDYGLLIEYAWQETLTDVVTLEDFRKARQELIDLLCEVTEETLQQALGEEYDTTRLMGWLRTEGAAFVTDTTDAIYDVASSKTHAVSGDSATDVLKLRVIEICQQHGFGVLFDDDAAFQDKAIRKLAAEIVQKTVSRRDGKPLEESVVRGLVGATGLSQKDGKSTVSKQLLKAWKRVVAARAGGHEGFDAELKKLSTRIKGVHGGLIPGSPEEFRFLMDFPGVVVETNGVLVAGGRVRWQFSGSDAWPSGFSMTGRSLLDNSAGVDGLQHWRKSLNRESLNRLLDLVGGDQRLISVMQDCRNVGDLSPLENFIDTFDDADSVAAARNVRLLITGKDVGK